MEPIQHTIIPTFEAYSTYTSKVLAQFTKPMLQAAARLNDRDESSMYRQIENNELIVLEKVHLLRYKNIKKSVWSGLSECIKPIVKEHFALTDDLLFGQEHIPRSEDYYADGDTRPMHTIQDWADKVKLKKLFAVIVMDHGNHPQVWKFFEKSSAAKAFMVKQESISRKCAFYEFGIAPNVIFFKSGKMCEIFTYKMLVTNVAGLDEWNHSLRGKKLGAELGLL